MKPAECWTNWTRWSSCTHASCLPSSLAAATFAPLHHHHHYHLSPQDRQKTEKITPSTATTYPLVRSTWRRRPGLILPSLILLCLMLISAEIQDTQQHNGTLPVADVNRSGSRLFYGRYPGFFFVLADTAKWCPSRLLLLTSISQPDPGAAVSSQQKGLNNIVSAAVTPLSTTQQTKIQQDSNRMNVLSKHCVTTFPQY